MGFAFACHVRLMQELDLYKALALIEFLRCLITISCMIGMEMCVLRFLSPFFFFRRIVSFIHTFVID